jgi:hypothetical protein
MDIAVAVVLLAHRLNGGSLLEEGAEASGADLDLLGPPVDDDGLLLDVSLEGAGRSGRRSQRPECWCRIFRP